MTKVTCDLCGCTINDGADRVKMLLYGPAHDVDHDFCVACAVRVNNNLHSFIEAAKKKEAIRKAGEAACGGEKE